MLNILIHINLNQVKTQFEKDYNVIYLCLKDISEIMYELRDALIDAEAEYIKTDEECAKSFTQ